MADPDASENWLDDIEQAVVTVLLADPVLPGISGNIEAGVIDPLRQQELNGPDFPYVGIVVTGHSEDQRINTGEAIIDVEVRCSLAAIHAHQTVTQAQIKALISRLGKIVGNQLVGDRFNLVTVSGQISDVYMGRGQITAMMSSKDDVAFIVEGEYLFRVEYRMNLYPPQ